MVHEMIFGRCAMKQSQCAHSELGDIPTVLRYALSRNRAVALVQMVLVFSLATLDFYASVGTYFFPS